MRLILALCLLAAPAVAQDRACMTRVNHQDIVIAPGAIRDGATDLTLRERWLTTPGRLWDRAWGQPVACDSATTLAFLAGILGYGETDGFCLVQEDSEGFLLVPGARNFRGRCRRTVCDRVNMAGDQGLAAARVLAELVTGRDLDSPQDGLQAVASGTGAMLLSGRGPALAAALSEAGATLAAALATPAVAGATAATVLTVGGAVYLCRD